MDPVDEPLAPVLRDVAATTDLVVYVEQTATDSESATEVLVGVADGTSTTIFFEFAESEAEHIFLAAEAVQEIVIEEQSARSSNWPMCPIHRSTHPLQARLVADEAWWTCPADSSPVTRIGTLRL